MLISATIIFRTRLRNIFPTLRCIVILYYRVYTAKLQLRQFSNQQIYIFLPAILTISNGLSEYREFKIYISYQAPSLLDQRYGPLRFELNLPVCQCQKTLIFQTMESQKIDLFKICGKPMKNIFGKEFDQICETHTTEVVTKAVLTLLFI